MRLKNMLRQLGYLKKLKQLYDATWGNKPIYFTFRIKGGRSF